MKTDKNLEAAFAGESQANRKYLAFAEKADKDGFPQVAKLFRAIGAAETVHAHAHLRAMGGIKDTADNVQAAIDGEAHEFKSMYPEFLAAAEAEGEKRAATSFRYALAVEEIHHGYYEKALEQIRAGSDLAEAALFVCPVCGNTVFGEAPDKCEICGVSKEKFFEVK